MFIKASLWTIVVVMLLFDCAAWEHLSFDPENFLCKEYDTFCNTFLDRISCTSRTVTGCVNNSLTSYIGICSCSEPVTYDISGLAIGKNLFDNRIRPDIGWNMLPWTGPPYDIGDSYSSICSLALRRLGCSKKDMNINAVKMVNSSTGKVEQDYQCTCGTFTLASSRVNDVIVGNVVASQMALTPIFENPITLSIQLSLGLTFLIGKLGAELATMLYFPSILGYLVAGIGFQDLINPGVMKGCGVAGPSSTPQGELKTLVLIIVLMRAGLGLDAKKLYEKGVLTISLACIPYFCEFIVELYMASYIFNWSYVEAGMYASVLAALSPALVISGMIKMVNENLGGTPKQVLASAPLEVVLAVILFQVFVSFAQSSGNPLYPWVRVLPLWANIVLIPVNIAFSSVLGCVLGWCLSSWYRFRTTQSSATSEGENSQGRSDYHKKAHSHIARATGCSTAECLFLYLVGCYILYSLCTVQYIQQSSGVLAVFVTSLTVAELAPHTVVHGMKESLAGLWVFAEVALFTFVGASLSFNTENGPLQSNRGINVSKVHQFCAVMFMGTAGRFLGISATYAAFLKKLPEHKQTIKYIGPLIIFTLLSTIAKATVQATLGSLPLQYQWISGVDGVRTAVTIQQGAGFSILIMAPIGALLTQAISRPLAVYLADLDRKAFYVVDFDDAFDHHHHPVSLSPVEVLAEEAADILARHMLELDSNKQTFIERVHRLSVVPDDDNDDDIGTDMVKSVHSVVTADDVVEEGGKRLCDSSNELHEVVVAMTEMAETSAI